MLYSNIAQLYKVYKLLNFRVHPSPHGIALLFMLHPEDTHLHYPVPIGVPPLFTTQYLLGSHHSPHHLLHPSTHWDVHNTTMRHNPDYVTVNICLLFYIGWLEKCQIKKKATLTRISAKPLKIKKEQKVHHKAMKYLRNRLTNADFWVKNTIHRNT